MYSCFLNLLALSLALLTGCSNPDVENKGTVIVYTSVDQVFSSKILKQFEQDTGIIVKALYDTEASKAIGLEKRLLAEKENPKADVFWNSEFMRTARLEHAGVFEKYEKDTSNYINDKYYSAKGLWYGMGGRSRVLIVNKDLIKERSSLTSLTDILRPEFKGKIAICTPYVGTTSTHFAALYNKFGKQKFEEFLIGLKNNNVAMLAGNSVVKDAVGKGKFVIGLVDTDDALVGIEQGLPIEMVYYDQERDGMFLVFQTLSLVKGGKNQANGKILIDYLLRNKIEQQLIDMNAVQISILDVGPAEKKTPKIWTASPEVIRSSLPESIALLRHYLD